MSRAYYNEIDPYAAQWLRNLISAGHIAPGDVDERSIVDVRADDLGGYTQCHFFAGIGGWSSALRLADWPDDRPVWTGSCPCQPLSAAGKRLGAADERHLWPDWFKLIEQRRPITVFGEQVASKDGLAWLDIVQSDLENARYASGAVDLCAAGVGAPHIRQRLWFVAYANGGDGAEGLQRGGEHRQQPENGRSLRMADAGHNERPAWPARGEHQSGPSICERAGSDSAPGVGPADRGRMGDAGGAGLSERKRDRRVQREAMGPFEGQATIGGSDIGGLVYAAREQMGLSRCAREPRTTNGFWSDAEWIACTDGKARPVEPGTFPLAHGIPGRVGRLRAYGNAIVAPLAAEFIGACMEYLP